uniref:Glutaredoxin domain-containing protein n=1 Tax=Panagrolaimus sp. PS1159 TaxID=55785 RepID=A0AC35G4L0_9BILA
MLSLCRRPIRTFLPLGRNVFRAYSTSENDAKISQETYKRIDSLVKNDPVVVFMKGTQDQPACGFSRNVKLVLDFHEVPFKDYNVLEDEEIRNGVKIYSNWPTIPQVYVKGEFVGGSDILIQMHKDGELTEFFDQNKIPSKFSDKPKNE